MVKKMIAVLVISGLLIAAGLVASALFLYLHEDRSDGNRKDEDGDDMEEAGLGVFGVDYWFEADENGTEYLETSDGWTFDLNVRKDYSLTGRILGYKYYHKTDVPYKAVNIFSPVDIWVGVDDVSENISEYRYTINSWQNRTIKWFLYEDEEYNFTYFWNHTGLNHLIPHNPHVLSQLYRLRTGDMFTLSGSIVEPYGTRENIWFNWPSDTTIGNEKCEVILVDTVMIH